MTSQDFTSYDLYIFDCDGVILDSNPLKSEAFYVSVLEFGHHKAEQFLEYHEQNRGISRYRKFEYFFTNIHVQANIEIGLYVDKYASLIADGYFHSNITDGFLETIGSLADKECYVVSGSDEYELKEVFKFKKLSLYFNAIYGSPYDKVRNINMHINYQHKKVLFIGDSQEDLRVSKAFNFDFLFVSGYCSIDLDVLETITTFKELS